MLVGLFLISVLLHGQILLSSADEVTTSPIDGSTLPMNSTDECEADFDQSVIYIVIPFGVTTFFSIVALVFMIFFVVSAMVKVTFRTLEIEARIFMMMDTVLVNMLPDPVIRDIQDTTLASYAARKTKH